MNCQWLFILGLCIALGQPKNLPEKRIDPIKDLIPKTELTEEDNLSSGKRVGKLSLLALLSGTSTGDQAEPRKAQLEGDQDYSVDNRATIIDQPKSEEDHTNTDEDQANTDQDISNKAQVELKEEQAAANQDSKTDCDCDLEDQDEEQNSKENEDDSKEYETELEKDEEGRLPREAKKNPHRHHEHYAGHHHHNKKKKKKKKKPCIHHHFTHFVEPGFKH